MQLYIISDWLGNTIHLRGRERAGRERGRVGGREGGRDSLHELNEAHILHTLSASSG